MVLFSAKTTSLAEKEPFGVWVGYMVDTPALPPPHLHICLYGEEQVSQKSLVHVGPFVFWDTEHGGTGRG